MGQGLCYAPGEDLAGFAFDLEIEGAAADLAVGGQVLVGQAGIDDQIELLAAEGALDGLGDFHSRGFTIMKLALVHLTVELA